MDLKNSYLEWVKTHLYFLIPVPRDKFRGYSINYYIMNYSGINFVAAQKNNR